MDNRRAVYIERCTYGSGEGRSKPIGATQKGGFFLSYYSSVRLDIRRIDSIKSGNEIIGNRTRVKVVKNKVAPPFLVAEFDIIYGTGISKEGCILDVASDLGIVSKSGSWFSYGDMRLGQGRENAKEFLRQNQELYNEIESKVREKASLPGYHDPAEDDDGGKDYLDE